MKYNTCYKCPHIKKGGFYGEIFYCGHKKWTFQGGAFPQIHEVGEWECPIKEEEEG